MKKRATTFDRNFILGSVAEVERVFSFAKYVLSDSRRCMTPPTFFEALMFLKINSRFWGCCTSRRSHRRSSKGKSIGSLHGPTEFGMMLLEKKSSSGSR